MRRIRNIICLLVLASLALSLSACGLPATLRVTDRGVTTTLRTQLPKTVAQVLDEAEITLRDGDEVSPAPGTVLTSSQEITVLRENAVLLTAGGKTRTVLYWGGTVGELLQAEGIRLEGGLHANVELDRPLCDGMEIWVSDSFRVTVLHDGESLTAYVSAPTVGQALAECGVALGPNDRVSPATDQPVSQDLSITVGRVSYDTLTQDEPVGYETRYETDESLAPGTEQLSRTGQDGLKRVTYRLTLVDGAEESREALAEEILTEPTDALVLTGPKDLSAVSIVSKKAYYDCDGSGHGYYEITYSDGSVSYESF